MIEKQIKGKGRIKHWRWVERGLMMLGLISALILVVGVAYGLAYWGKILPGVKIAGVAVGNLTGEEAVGRLSEKVLFSDLVLRADDKEFVVIASEMGLEVDWPATINQAWLVGRSGGGLERLGQAQESYFSGKQLGLVVKVNENDLNQRLEEVEGELNEEAVKPAIEVSNEKEGPVVEVSKGRNGKRVDRERLRSVIVERWSRLEGSQVEIPVETIVVEVDEEARTKTREAAERLLQKELVLRLDGEEWSFGGEELVALLRVAAVAVFDEVEVRNRVIELGKAINRQPVNAAFRFEDGRVQEFAAGKEGVVVQEEEMVKRVLESHFELLEREKVEIEVAVVRTEPKIKTSEVNNLGIVELLGKGESTYFHSIPNRVHNLALAASRLAGVLVAPGEEFSFNENVGEISGATGYKPAYVISGGRTILGDGGGVCQVSTTLFRAALKAGLPITERKAHAYRVGYYEQDAPPGIDATVYSPTVDLRFRNDTPAHLLIQPVIDIKNYYLSFEIYGTSDGRVAEMSKPKLWGLSPPPPAVYQDDPTLPLGTTKQVDFAAGGAKTSFDYKVTRGGAVIFEKTFVSSFRPWQAVYLRGTKTN